MGTMCFRLLALLLASCAATGSFAQSPSTGSPNDWPTRAARIIVPAPPGQAIDVLARLLGAELQKNFGQPFVIDNKPGAGGRIAADAAAKAAPDGYTLVMTAVGPFATGPAIFARMTYDPIKDFAHISKVALTPQMLLVSASSPYNSVRDLVAAAKANPGKLAYGSGGVGLIGHLAAEMFQRAAGIQLNHVPFKGNPEVAAQILGGNLVMMFDTVPGSLGLVKSGKLRALGVASSTRSPFLPDLPTFVEQGMPGVEAVGWIGVSAPAGTPDVILDKLNGAIRRTLQVPEVKERLSSMAFAAVGDSRSEFTAFIESELSRWATLAKDAGIKEQ